jgi:hypothetical protein
MWISVFGLPFVRVLTLEVKRVREKNMHVRHEDVEDVWAKDGGNNRRLGKIA